MRGVAMGSSSSAVEQLAGDLARGLDAQPGIGARGGDDGVERGEPFVVDAGHEGVAHEHEEPTALGDAREGGEPDGAHVGRPTGFGTEIVEAVNAAPPERDLRETGAEHLWAHSVAEARIVAVAEPAERRFGVPRPVAAGGAKPDG